MPQPLGPLILVQTMSRPTTRGASTRAWQYHSRSDNHSKLACWTLLFDLLSQCDAARAKADVGGLGFRLNHVMVGPINKTLDLVVTLVPPDRDEAARRTFTDLADELGVVLDAAQRRTLAALPVVYEDRRDDVSEVAIALEAKACMTEHSKSMPRLHAEILATGYLARQATPRCITVSYSLVNAAPDFVSPGAKAARNNHDQPTDAQRVVAMLTRAIPLERTAAGIGYDVVGVTVLECRNDGSPVVLCEADPAPGSDNHVHYERMLRSLCSEFRSRFR
ncbi:MAG: hypothetical protein LW768_02830 [Rubrivivax sp.]|jgi:hypothetical protein|nr:hypothetical protein [Rubrivivax sp.]